MIIHLQVLETTHQVGRISVSTPSDMPYREMALHCEALLMGKQQKLSTFMGTHPLHGNSFSIPPSHDYNQGKDMSSNNVQQSLPLVLLYFHLVFQFRISLVHFEISASMVDVWHLKLHFVKGGFNH